MGVSVLVTAMMVLLIIVLVMMMLMRVIVIMMMMRMIVRVMMDALGRPAAARVLAEQERLDGHRDGV